MGIKWIIFICLFVSTRCFIKHVLKKIKKTNIVYLNQNKTPLIIYDSESNKVILKTIGSKMNNQSYDDGNYTAVRREVEPMNPISPCFENLCKMNFVTLV